jgi:hypothetical protein
MFERQPALARGAAFASGMRRESDERRTMQPTRRARPARGARLKSPFATRTRDRGSREAPPARARRSFSPDEIASADDRGAPVASPIVLVRRLLSQRALRVAARIDACISNA